LQPDTVGRTDRYLSAALHISSKQSTDPGCRHIPSHAPGRECMPLCLPEMEVPPVHVFCLKPTNLSPALSRLRRFSPSVSVMRTIGNSEVMATSYPGLLLYKIKPVDQAHHWNEDRMYGCQRTKCPLHAKWDHLEPAVKSGDASLHAHHWNSPTAYANYDVLLWMPNGINVSYRFQ
jgi:hypothetical protein